MSDDADLLAYYRIAFDACVSPRAPSVSELEYVLQTALSLLRLWRELEGDMGDLG